MPMTWKPEMNLMGSLQSGHSMIRTRIARRPTLQPAAMRATEGGCHTLSAADSGLHLLESSRNAPCTPSRCAL
eukprot:15016806-Heterocapsa_arctica.AAC.1